MFRNPTLANGSRESAGKLIDLAGLKGTRVGCAYVSSEHGNFIAVDDKAATASTARTDDVRALVELIQETVERKHGVRIETEVVFWRRGERP
jgi:UDP-N-acetylmuramate dehydrogenase